MNIIPKLVTLQCNHCGNRYSGAEIGSVCPDCQEGVLICDDRKEVNVARQQEAASFDASEIDERVSQVARQRAAQIHKKAANAELIAKVLYGIALFILVVGVFQTLQTVADSETKVSLGWFYWSGALGLAGFMETLIAQLLYIRASLDSR